MVPWIFQLALLWLWLVSSMYPENCNIEELITYLQVLGGIMVTMSMIWSTMPFVSSVFYQNSTGDSTDKWTDTCSRHFMIWKIKSGFCAVGWAGLWNKRFGPIMSNFWGRFFQLFVGNFFWKHCCDRTEKLHRKKINNFFWGGGIFFFFMFLSFFIG